MSDQESMQPVSHVVSPADVEQIPELTEAGIQAGSKVLIFDTADGVPVFTIRADSMFGIRCMIAFAGLADTLPPEERAQILRTLREFDLYEEMHRGEIQ